MLNVYNEIGSNFFLAQAVSLSKLHLVSESWPILFSFSPDSPSPLFIFLPVPSLFFLYPRPNSTTTCITFTSPSTPDLERVVTGDCHRLRTPTNKDNGVTDQAGYAIERGGSEQGGGVVGRWQLSGAESRHCRPPPRPAMVEYITGQDLYDDIDPGVQHCELRSVTRVCDDEFLGLYSYGFQG